MKWVVYFILSLLFVYNSNSQDLNMSKEQVLEKEIEKGRLINPDKTAPETDIYFDGKQVIERDTLFITSDTEITLSSADQESGIKKINFGMDEYLTYLYIDKFNVADEGKHKIIYRALDKANNTEKTKSKFFVVDNTPPQIDYTFSYPSHGEKEIDGIVYTAMPKDIKIQFAAQDKTTGVKNVWYQINGEATKMKNEIGNLSSGKFKVQIFAQDHLGNQSEVSLNILIE